MNIMIGNEVYFKVKGFYTEYQKGNGHRVFIIEENGHQYAVNYNPRKEQIQVYEDN